ncbi:hypothetical protein [Azonexus sp.]|uniref:hypothetical protein n=1 Tax=Azonexus sp. TaxID=1872668 RepID=UPI00283A9BCF|nr:hypothetical protein [Azonexus sp.]
MALIAGLCCLIRARLDSTSSVAEISPQMIFCAVWRAESVSVMASLLQLSAAAEFERRKSRVLDCGFAGG